MSQAAIARLKPWLARLQGLVLVGVVGAMVVLVAQRWGEIQRANWQFNGWWLALAVAIVTMCLIGWSLVWAWMVRQLGQTDVPLRQIATVYLYGNAAKYLPGAIWNYVARAYLGAQRGIAQQRVWTASLIDVTTAIASGLLVYGVSGLFPRQHAPLLPVWAPFVLAFGVLCLISPPALRVLDRVVRQITKQQSSPVVPPWHVTARYVVCAFLIWCVIGVAFWALINGVYPLEVAAAPEAMGLWSLAVISGLVSVVTPQGLGVREGALALGLSAVLPAPVVVVVAMATRLWMIVCDVLAVLVWWTAAIAETRRAGDTTSQRADSGPVTIGTSHVEKNVTVRPPPAS